jgi:pimeloyl-ACP methyl ester carboxylesterase
VETVRSADGTSLTVRQAGNSDPVILVHGSAGGLDSWDPILPMLTADFEVWVYARRGYSPSDPVPGQKSFADDVADLSAVVAAAGGAAHVVGASYGATVVLHAALQGLDGLRSLVAFEPPLYSAGAALQPVLTEYDRLLSEGAPAAAARLFAERVARIPSSLLDALGPQEPDPDELAGCRSDLEAMAADTLDLQRWSGIAQHLLLLSGTDTWAPMPETMRALAHVLPSAEYVRLAGQSHFATHTAPQQLADSILPFLRAASSKYKKPSRP